MRNVRIKSAEFMWTLSVGLRAPYRPKYFDRAEHNQTARGVLGFVVCRKLSFFGHTIRDGGCEIYSKVCDTEGIALEDLSLI